MTPSWHNFSLGDIIVAKDGSKARVLAITGDIFARSAWYSYDTFQEWVSIKDAIKRDWRLVQHDDTVPMTKSEIEMMLGHKVLLVKSKKHGK